TLDGHSTQQLIDFDAPAMIADEAQNGPRSVQGALVDLKIPGSASITGNRTVETLTIGSSTGTFDLTINGTKLTGLDAKIKASELLNQIGTVVGASNVTVTGTAGGPYTITFATPLTSDPSVTLNGGTLDADHIKVIKKSQGDQTIYTVSFL